MRIEARAPAKLVLMGEYAVLEGAPAIVAAVNRLVRVELVPAPKSPEAAGPWTVATDLAGGQEAALRCDADGALESGADWLRPVVSVLTRAAASAGLRPADLPGGRITIESASLYVDAGETKLGLGSSAAVVAALSAALHEALVHWALAPPAANSLAEDLAAHRAVQAGQGSGVDVAASVIGGILRYQLVDGQPRAEPLALPEGVEFGVVWTGVATSTPAFVQTVHAWKAAQPEAYRREMDTLCALAERAVAACRENDAAAFLGTVRGYREALDGLGRGADLPIVSTAHRAIADLAEGEGVAYKPSGAGGGDVGLLFASSRPALVQAGRLAERAGYRLLDLGVHPVGVQVIRHERTAS